MLVEADDAKQAFSIIYDKLGEGEPRWSDWNEVGLGNANILNFAGRWSGEFFAVKGVDETPNYLRFSDDPAMADKVIDTFMNYRLNEIQHLRKVLQTDYAGIDVINYDYNPDETDYKKSLVMYYIKKLTLLLSNEWCAETAIYDLENWDANLQFFYKRVQENPQRQFLIPVDFHH